MKVILFRSRLRDGVDADAYNRHAEALYAIASTISGFVSAEDFAGDGGQRLAVIAFQDDDSLAAWRNHPVHRAAQQRGRDQGRTKDTGRTRHQAPSTSTVSLPHPSAS